MEVVRGVDQLRDAILELRRAGHAIGFVPTTGLVHSGQLSLMRRARETDGGVVVSNQADPTGAAAEEGRLLSLLEAEGVDVAFLPSPQTVDPPHVTRVTVDGLTGRLEGASRPGYLDEVATTTMKLLHLVGPARLYLGQKDAQRVVVVQRMLRDLFVNVELVVCPIVRDPDGLAVSAANMELSIEERHAATCLCAAIAAAEAAHLAGERSAEVLRARITELISAESMARLDYVSVADAETLAELSRVDGPALAMAAAWIGRTRLTDNVPLV
ncbi:MAG: 4-phosphopantoate--beta-alanine ligase [Candidatus Limnocylindria bacterium]